MGETVHGVLTGTGAAPLILGSASAVRAALLRNAGLAFRQQPASVDEEEIKLAVKAELGETDQGAVAVAETLAELKAVQVSRNAAGALVIGADQVLACEGAWFDKAATTAAARKTLTALRGRSHKLISAVCVVQDGRSIWRHEDHATLEMRSFSDRFLDNYLAAAGDDALKSVGAYQLEGLGAQLFARVDGDYFTVLGLPLLPLLEFLRGHGVVGR